ncbi:hypothetical protein GCM10023231_17210 [Olivibacter ginsenosidimutans]|uniref:Uncharacterized protein n=1 Tax=Olivibacter ginsenosidimutans TaxID=1176537 RepID=A0ABP9B6R2_9SPHI
MEVFRAINYVELIVGGTFGAILGLLISEFKGCIARRRKKKKTRELYEVMCGEYKRQLERANEYVKAVITYQYENILHIDTKTYSNEVMQEHWRGEIKMDTTNQGLVVWYHEDSPGLDKNGFKRIIVSPDRLKITLLGEGIYGVEELRRDNTKHLIR